MRTLPLALTALCTAAGIAGAPSAYAADQDPKGNNGTVKIDGASFDGSRGNEPHVGCTFHLDFFGFDAAQTATITFTGQAPTKTGTLLTQKEVAISDDAAGGGQDTDAVLSYTAEQLGLTGQPAAKQGWHVKVAVDVDDAPGGAKQKVFWLSCPGPSPETTSGSGTTKTTTPSSTTPTSTTPASTTPATSTTTSEIPPTFGGGEVTTTVPTHTVATDTPVTGTGGGATTAQTPLAPTYGSGSVSSNAASAPLPFTGDSTGTLLLVGAGAIAAGTALTVMARRRRTT